MAQLRSVRYPISPLEAIVLLQNVLNCEDASNDADRTVDEIIAEIDAYDGYITKGLMESGLYCCNMEDERQKFWHPYAWTFDKFLEEILPRRKVFNKYYNVIVEEKKDGLDDKAGR